MRTVQPSPAATLRSASASGTRLLFVYGALLSPALLPSDRPWWRAECPDRRVEFRQKGGYATLEVPEEGMRSFCSPQPAQGIVVALSDADTEELQRREVGYDLLAVDVEVEVEDDEAAVRLAAEAFVCSWWHRLPRPVPPTRRYIEKILTGASARGLPAPYVQWLEEERDAVLGRRARSRSDGGGALDRYDTPQRRLGAALASIAFAAFVAAPICGRVAECSASGWTGDCSTFFPAGAGRAGSASGSGQQQG